MRSISDVLTVCFDSELKDKSALCVTRKHGEGIIVLKMEFGEQADILYHLLTEPSVTPTRPKGKWEYDADKDKSGGHCNRCGHFLRYGEKTNFCPDCGADMREVEE